MMDTQVQAEWKKYFTAMKAGDPAEMTRVYNRIEVLQRAEHGRRTTRRMLAVAHVDTAYALAHTPIAR